MLSMMPKELSNGWCQYRQVAVVHHHDAADEQGNDDRRHYADGTMGHGTFDFAARFARNAAGVQNGENQHFENTPPTKAIAQ